MPTILRYLLFQLPQWVLLALFLWFLVDRAAVTAWVTFGFFVMWVVKDFAIYPIVRTAYETDNKVGAELLIGGKGIAQDTLDPEGYIRINGELWKARLESIDRPIARNSPVRVTGAHGLTLVVEEEVPSTRGGNQM
jgi:membrane-bound ClpP family serine protease